jgi:hypothetical protein
MTRRLTLAAAAMLVASFALSLPATAQKNKKGKGPKVTFSKKSVTPKTVAGGAKVTVAVTIVPSGGAVVSGASVRLVRTGANPSSSAMQSAGSNQWAKNLAVPGNFGKTAVNVDVYVDAASSIGTVSTKVGTVKVNPSVIDGNSPPPPPDI